MMASHVRMVQLFLDLETFPEFQELVDVLGEHYQTTTPTDTVMRTLREAAKVVLEPNPE
jgi:hypothetical protein